jgi:uncharacterized membrane protein YbhN (UPF0104 family)
MVAWLVGLAVFWLALQLLGLDVRGWLSDLWDQIKDIWDANPGYIVGALALQTGQTVFAGLSYYGILRVAYPGKVELWPIIASYAVGVAMNGFLPANIGTLASLLMYMSLIRGSTFPGMLGAMTVQKIFYTVIGTVVYLYLFLSVPGTFNLQLGLVDEHRLLVPLLIVGAGFLIFLLIERFWGKLKGLWEKAKQGGAILARPRDYVVRVLVPSFGAWICKLVVIGIFLAAYGIPVTFHTIMSVVGGNSLANTVSFTPGGVGITQAVNTASLSSVTSADTAAAYSLGQQLITTAWNVAFATVLVVWVFGWTGGKQMIGSSYTGAKERAAEQAAARKERKAEKKAAKDAGEVEGTEA